MLVTGIVMSITGGLVILISRSASNTLNTVRSVQADEVASDAILPYLHAAVSVSSATPTSFTLSTYSGINDYNSSGTNYGTPTTDDLTVQFVQVSTQWKLEALLTNTTTNVTTTVAVADAEKPTTAFTYYDANQNQLGAQTGDNGTVPSCALDQIAQIDITIPFLTGSTRGGNADANQVSDWVTDVYLENVSLVSTTSTTSPCTT